MEKKMTRTIKSGKRVEILKTLYANGVLPYKSLKLYNGETGITQRKVKEMENDGEITRIGTGKDSIIVLHNGWKEGTQHWKNKAYIARREELQEELYKCLSEGGTRLNRFSRRAELNLMMHLAGVGAYPDEKPVMNDITNRGLDAFYYNADEVKNATCYVDDVKEEDGKKQTSISRLSGLEISQGGIYATYSLGSKLIEWNRFGEVRMKELIKRTLGERSQKIVENSPIDCIMFTDDYKLFERVILNELETHPAYNTKILLNIDFAYEHMYALPTDKNGIAMLEEMKKKNWLKEMRHILLGDYNVPPMGTQVVCDAVEDDKYILMFTSCDISRLKSFIKRARMTEEPERFMVYCFSFQTPLIKRLAGDYVTIGEIELADYKEEVRKHEAEII
jgi:hypothetical protein